MNKTLGSGFLISGTMIGAGMLGMPLTSAGLGFKASLLLLIFLWWVLTCSALLYVEIYQVAQKSSGIAHLAGQIFDYRMRFLVHLVLLLFLYALLSAYIVGGSEMSLRLLFPKKDIVDFLPLAALCFTFILALLLSFELYVVDYVNRALFVALLLTLLFLLLLMLPKVRFENLLASPLDGRFFFLALPVFFTAFGFHGSIPMLHGYLEGNSFAFRRAIFYGSALTVLVYAVWLFAGHGILSQQDFMVISEAEDGLSSFVLALQNATGSLFLALAMQCFALLALLTSFIGVALGIMACLRDVFVQDLNWRAPRYLLVLFGFLPPLVFALFFPQGFLLALSYAGQMFAFFAVVLPALLAWRVRLLYPSLPYRVFGGRFVLLLLMVLGVVIAVLPFFIVA